MASVSGASGLGNTSLRGYGGFASGIDRDSIIEQMTMGTQSKITNMKKSMQSLQWKQEVFQTLSDKIIGLNDDYFSYSSPFNLKDSNTFARNLITSLGDEKYTKYVNATGTSSLVDQLSILAVKELASSSVRKSAGNTNGSLDTSLESMDDNATLSNLSGSQLWFGTWNAQDEILENRVKFALPSSYKDADGISRTIDYTTTDYDTLAKQINAGLKDSTVKLGNDKIADVIEFQYDTASGTMKINKIKADSNFVMDANSSALKGLGYQKLESRDKDGVDFNEYNSNLSSFAGSYVTHQTFEDYLVGKKLTFDYNGGKKEIELLTADEAAALTGSGGDKLKQVRDNIQSRLDRAFGQGNVTVELPTDDGTPNGNPTGALSFKTANGDSTVSVTSSDNTLLKNLGLAYGASNKVNLQGRLEDNLSSLGINAGDISNYMDPDSPGNLFLEINGVKIEGLTTESSIKEILNKINSTPEAGVKASYVDATGQFALVSTETGKGRTIDINGALGEKLFMADPADPDDGFVEGKNAVVTVSYGNGMIVDMERSSNTFDLEGLKVTVSGKFGYDDSGIKDHDHLDSSQAVSFGAKADVDGVTEKMTKFFEAYNEMITEINNQLTTKPDGSYGPLTDEQKEEMSETSVKNWEEKAKQGLLFGNTIIKDLSTDVQNILLETITNGASFDDLEEIGITFSQEYKDGGTITFDQSKFKDAMTNNPDKVSNIICGGGNVRKGLAETMEETLNPYATRYSYKNGGSYGRLVEEAGSEKAPLSITSNYIYKQLKDMEESLTKLKDRLSSEQDRYIRQFTTMETMISQMNAQSSWLMQMQG
ncbi:flagellar filament capping protein FliD [Hungatella hathewayi]|uniref:flagellar filament capping protein FliD n=1 Tax=Hungatella hathewayi TaxID=154046 RepID=UPI003564FDF7